MKKRLAALGLALCMVFTSSGMTVLAEQAGGSAEGTPRSISVLSEGQEERSILFNDDWKFSLGSLNGAEAKEFDDSGWRGLDLPHDWSIEFDFSYSSAATSECGYLDGGTGWYRKSFVLPESMKGKQISIDFGGVYMNSTTYVNGKSIGTYPYGYMPFSYDITDELVCDGQGTCGEVGNQSDHTGDTEWFRKSGHRYKGEE